MFQKLLQLARHSATYGFGSIAAKLVAVVMVPIYIRFLDPSAYGIAEVVMTINLFVTALVKVGLQNSMMRFYYEHPDDRARGEQVVRTTFTAMLANTALASLVMLVFAGPIAEFFFHDSSRLDLILISIFGLFAMVIYQTITSTLRLEKRAGTYLRWSLANISFTVLFTLSLVVFVHAGAAGLLMGNFMGTAVLIPFLLWQQRRFVRLQLRGGLLGPMLSFGLPTMPMAVANQGLNMIDRTVLARAASLSELGLYSVAAKMAQVVFLVVLALQMSWQPFAYSIRDDEEARRTYSVVMSYFAGTCGWLVAAVALLADPAVRLLTTPAYYDAAGAVPLLAAAAGVYGIYFLAGIGAGRVKKTRYHFAVALGALVVSLVGNLTLVAWLGLGIMGAAWSALAANATLSVLMVFRSQHVFPVPYEWRRIATALLLTSAAMAAAAAIPGGEAWALPLRIAGVLAYPAALWMLGFFPANERRAIVRRMPLLRGAGG